jgi:uncharacterized membrane protein YbhN (UPF0104 family)
VSAIAVDRPLSRPLRAHTLRIAVGVAVLGGGAALAARRVDLGAVASTDVVWGWVTLALVLNLASIATKATVWKAALDAVPGSRPVRYAHVVPALFVGFLLNTVLFARLGEVARISVLGRRLSRDGEPRPTTEIAGSALAEQLVLAGALALVAGILALTLGVPALVWQLLAGLLAGIAVLLVVLVVLARLAPRTRASRAGSALRGLASGQALLRSRRQLLLALAAGSLSWAAQVAGIWAALAGFDIHVGLGAAGAVFLASTLVQLFPFWPGNLGVFQLGVAAPLAHLYGVDAASALAFSVGLQLIEGVLGVGLGAAFLAREGLGLRSAALRLSARVPGVAAPRASSSCAG